LVATYSATAIDQNVPAIGQSIIGGAIPITVPAGGARVVLLASTEMLEEGPAGNITMSLIIDGADVYDVGGFFADFGNNPAVQMTLAANFRSAVLSAGAHTVDLQAFSQSGSAVARTPSLVALVVTV
jgi:hypothetical protein